MKGTLLWLLALPFVLIFGGHGLGGSGRTIPPPPPPCDRG